MRDSVLLIRLQRVASALAPFRRAASVRAPFQRAARALAAIALCSPGAWALAASGIVEGRLTVGSDLTYPPYAFFEAGKPAGFDADFARLLAAKLSLQPVFVDTRFPDLILGLRAHRFDIVASALYMTPERAKLIDFIAYLKTGAALLVPAASSDAPATPQALCGKRVASIKGASWTPKLHKVTRELCQPTGRRAIEVLEFPSSPEALMALRSQAADAMMEDAAVAHAMLAQTNNAVKLSSTALLYPVVIGLGLHRDARQLQGQLQQALDQARASGEYAALLSRYGLQPPSPADIEAALAVPPK